MSFPTAFCSWQDPRGDGDREERAAIDRVIASGRFTMAGEVEAFESELAAWHGRAHAIMVNSGSSANLVAVAALANRDGGWRRFDGLREGFVAPAVAWATTYAPPIQYGLIPALIDVDDTWNSPADLVDRARWRNPPRLLVAVPVLGNAAHIYGWQVLASKLRISLLVDACESIGAHMPEGRQSSVAIFGDLATLSFFHSHQLSAIEGGAILTDDHELARLCRLLRNHGNAGWGSENFETSYNFEVFGYNVRPLEMHAAIAREQLRKLPDMIRARQLNLAHFRDETHNLPIIHQRLTGIPSPFGLSFAVESPTTRRHLVAALRAASIDARLPTGGSFSKHPYGTPWAEYNPTPNADRIHDTGLFLGNAPYPIPDLVERAVKVMKETL